MSEAEESRFHEIKATGDLPSPTGVALALLQATQREDATLAEIASILQADPALCARLIKFVNSPYVGQRRPVVSVPDAVLLVGLHVVRQIVLGLSVLSQYRKGRCLEFDYQGYWAEALATAIALEALSSRDKTYPAEEGFSVGLLSGIGRLALATVYPGEYSEILLRLRGQPLESLLPVEEEKFLTNHIELAAAMFEDWGMPCIHIEALRGLYGAELVRAKDKRTRRLARLLHMAARLARICVGDESQRNALTPRLVEEAQEMGLDEPAFAEFFDGIVREWRSWAVMLDVSAGEVPAFTKLLEQARDEHRAVQEAPSLPSTPDGLRILVVDDDPVTVELLRDQLHAAGHAVMTAPNGQVALEIALHNAVELIITDWLMPEMDGIEFCRALRGTRHGQRIYIIMLTGQEDDACLVRAFEAGADDYIVKPVNPRVLAARIRGGARLIRLRHEVEHEREENRQYLAELAVANRRLEQAALTDVLTGLPNRRYATRRLNQAWSAAKRVKAPLACMLIDIDHFKQINDTYGHQQGDLVLCEIARVLRAAARTDDEVCRIGGEEFLVICANSDARSAQGTAERLRAAVEGHPIELQGTRNTLTVSIGVAVHARGDSSPDALLKAADKAVYTAKRLGRNRVVTIGETLPPGAASGIFSAKSR